METDTSRRYWFALKLTLIIAILVILFISLLPFGVQYGLQYWLKKELGSEVIITDVDVNLFTLEADIKQLAFQNPNNDHLKLIDVDIAVKKLFDKKVEISDTHIEGLQLFIRQLDKYIDIAGFKIDQNGKEEPVTETEPEHPWHWGIKHLVIKDTRLSLQKNEHSLNIEIDTLSLENLHSDTPDNQTRLTFKGKIADSPITIDGNFTALGELVSFSALTQVEQLAIERLKPWTGELPIVKALISINSNLELNITRDQRIEMKQRGNLSVEKMHYQAQPINSRAEQIQWSGELSTSISPENQVSLKQQGELSLTKVQYNDQLLNSSIDRLNWKGELSGTMEKNNTLDIKGRLSISKPELILGNKAFVLQLQEFTSQHNSHFIAESFADSLKFTGNIGLTQMAINSPVKEVSWLELENLQVTEAQIDSLNNIAIEQLLLTNYSIGREQQGQNEIVLLKTGKTHLEKLVINNLSKIQVQKTFHDNLHSRIERKTDGELRVVGLFSLIAELNKTIKQNISEEQPTAPQQPLTAERPEVQVTETAAKTQADDDFQLQIDDFAVTKGSTITYVDYGVKPAYKTTLDINRFTWQGFDTEATKPGHVILAGKLDEFTDINIDSRVRIFGNKANFDSSIDIQSFPLPPISSYSVQSSGYAINSGQLDGKIKVKSENRKLDGNIKLDIHKLGISKSDIEKISKAKQKGADMSLTMALDLLRDNNDNISLVIPISGDLDRPDFGIQNIINKAVMSAAQKGAMTYLTSALQPYGTLITIAKYAGEQASKIRLKPVEFSQGESQLNKQAGDYLSKIADVLKQREKLKIKVCAFASETDRSTLTQQVFARRKEKERNLKIEQIGIDDETLRELALTRAQIVRSELIKTHGIASNRLINCLPAIDSNIKGLPRVELLL